MKLIWNGHSCFTLATEAGTLVIDPYEDGSVPGLSPLHLEADAVYCSHEHRDHGNRASVALRGKPCAVEVEELATWHDEVQGAKRGPNTMRIFSAEGLRVAHLGGLGCGLTPEQAEKDSRRSILLQCIGASPVVEPDFIRGYIEENACYMLCSDGFRHKISENEMLDRIGPKAVLDENAMREGCAFLTELDKYRKETDNITVLLIKTE